MVDVAEAAAEHGLAALAGSSPDVGVAGYTIGGGMSWLGRAYGLSANNVEAIEVVTADGRLVRADAGTRDRPVLGAARRRRQLRRRHRDRAAAVPDHGGLRRAAGRPAEAAAEVLHAWRVLTQCELPDEFTTSARLINVPRFRVAVYLRGKSFVVIFFIYLGAPAEADALLASLLVLSGLPTR